ncbi:hypothetical protein [Paenibacillus sp. J2TS4]|uniref:hypothetical protein n=1 Tax=Paenibacillus sp. J2TS4 TaxID=2807194 RepID=UPI001B0E32B8|nr:hypothetical protein [Paenibacillus sp. J2TS4]GIP35958.1 hypothetical protein J2TS4_51680 [Paenibacillus sp. J2TS4]
MKKLILFMTKKKLNDIDVSAIKRELGKDYEAIGLIEDRDSYQLYPQILGNQMEMWSGFSRMHSGYILYNRAFEDIPLLRDIVWNIFKDLMESYESTSHAKFKSIRKFLKRGNGGILCKMPVWEAKRLYNASSKVTLSDTLIPPITKDLGDEAASNELIIGYLDMPQDGMTTQFMKEVYMRFGDCHIVQPEKDKYVVFTQFFRDKEWLWSIVLRIVTDFKELKEQSAYAKFFNPDDNVLVIPREELEKFEKPDKKEKLVSWPGTYIPL